ncbi:NADH-quinone oxidoreductase subunit J family protein [Dehalogenimonas alkenigignens]|jgi:NADH:ubiquinone oxidoreductase subunit 6 (subunit J)|uniref:NADH-quinone oxidoreductase subunit J n=1 Tax=Dehalogenimonas alkenigignens TaxID=1217799 RepID=A0A0W0GJD6_9CHLR|nr:NADH-quinone oxidoreductase subunit J [Dehalogenimonas alkenigignens]KTB48654.1 NADH dehydrogenase subunit J [Dehalogenimonas alkenigignens]PVV84916.1 NADH-quinone oxidoreductase subunit L [Dehalogenimonas alkenigignens]
MALAFLIFSAGIIISALAVVLLKNIFRASLMLVLCFFLVAGLFASLSADFLAAIQVLIYVGAISVLIILAIMLTREITLGSLTNKQAMPALLGSGFVAAALVFSMLATDWNISTAEPAEPTTPILANLLFTPDNFMLPLEMAAVLMLTAIIGAIILVRDK